MMTDTLPHMPFAQRDETMYLDTVGEKDRTTHRLDETTRRGFYNPLEVDDIHGTKPKALHPERMNKPHQQFAYDFQDGMKPSRLHPMEFNKPYVNGKPMNLTNDDIDGSKPRVNNWNFKRSTDPLNPVYNLPSYFTHEPPPPKLMRDTLDITDIEGSRPKPLHTKWRQRDPINYRDVPGSTVEWKPSHKKIYSNPRDHIDCRDINGDGVFKTKRVTNPLTPRYRYDVPEDWQSRPSTQQSGAGGGSDRPRTTPAHWLQGEVPGNHPKPAPKERSVVYSLQCRDIEGTLPGWKPSPAYDEEARRHFRNTNFTGDIAGSYAGSLKRAFRRTRREFDTGRMVDPLNPDYDNARRTTSLPPRTTVMEGERPMTGTMQNENTQPPASPQASVRSRRSSRPQTQHSGSHASGAPRPATQGSQGSARFSAGAMSRAVQDIAKQQGTDTPVSHKPDVLKIVHSPPRTPLSENMRQGSVHSHHSHRSLMSRGSHGGGRLMTPSESRMRAAREQEERNSDIASVRSLQ